MKYFKFINLICGFPVVLLVINVVQASDIVEQEQNEPISLAQTVIPGMGDMNISAALGVLNGPAVEDVDFYKFYGQAGDVVTVDIDGGMGGVRDVDTIIAIFSSGPTYTMFRMNNDATPLDPGSRHYYDARVENFVLPETGNYFIGVSHWPRYFRQGGVAQNGAPRNGDYTVIISGVSANSSVVHVSIDVKPGSDTYAPLNPKSNGKVPVAILSTSSFDAMSVDPNSLTFGRLGTENSLSKCGTLGEDIDGNNRPDLVCHFYNMETGFVQGDLEGILRGQLRNGTVIEGRGLLKVVPEKRG